MTCSNKNHSNSSNKMHIRLQDLAQKIVVKNNLKAAQNVVFSPLFQGTKYISQLPPPPGATAKPSVTVKPNRARSILFKAQVASCKLQVANVSKLPAQVANCLLRVARSTCHQIDVQLLASCQLNLAIVVRSNSEVASNRWNRGPRAQLVIFGISIVYYDL